MFKEEQSTKNIIIGDSIVAVKIEQPRSYLNTRQQH